MTYFLKNTSKEAKERHQQEGQTNKDQTEPKNKNITSLARILYSFNVPDSLPWAHH